MWGAFSPIRGSGNIKRRGENGGGAGERAAERTWRSAALEISGAAPDGQREAASPNSVFKALFSSSKEFFSLSREMDIQTRGRQIRPGCYQT